MIDIERRLDESAAEIRDRTGGLLPPGLPLGGTRSRPRGWMVMAAGFALVVVALGLPALIGRMSGGSPPRAPETTAVLDPVATTGPSDPVTTVGSETYCPVQGVLDLGPQPGLPAPVAAARQGIATAALDCDWDRLAEYAVPDFTSSFGGGGFEEMLRSGPVELLVPLLNTPYGIVDSGEGRIFVWPSAFVYKTWDEVPEEDLRALDPIYKEDLYETMIPGSESYLGWRIGITERGEWLYFVAGD